MTNEILGTTIWRRCNTYKNWSPMHIITPEDTFLETINNRLIKKELKELAIKWIKNFMIENESTVELINLEFKITHCEITSQTRRLTKIYSKKDFIVNNKRRYLQERIVKIK